MKLALVTVVGLTLGGCAPFVGAGIGGGSFAAGWFTNPGNDIALLNAAMQVDAPFKYAWCAQHPSPPVAVAAYCANVPLSITDLPLTINKMIQAEMVK